MIRKNSKLIFICLILILLSTKYSLRLAPNSQLLQEHQIIEMVNNLPLYFVENKSQINDSVKYHVKRPCMNIYFTSEEIVYQFFHSQGEEISGEERLKRKEKERSEEVKVENIRMRFMGANEEVEVNGIQESEARMSYFRGNDSAKWVRGARAYHKVLYRELYPGIDLLVFGKGGGIKHEYRIRVGGEVDDITLRYEGIEQMKINEKGQLEIETGEGKLIEDEPLSYQVIDGQRVEVKTDYVFDKDNTLGFKVGEYIKDEELVIDPGLAYSSYIGESALDMGLEIAVDGKGNAYITGDTESSSFPTTSGAFDSSYNGLTDAFITKLNLVGTNLVYSTFLGGSDNDMGWGIIVDGSENTYVTGTTSSSDFPTTTGAYDTSHNGSEDVFITKLNSTGTDLLYSTYLGGSSDDIGAQITIDGNGNACVVGYTYSTDFPTPNGYDTTHNGFSDGFLAKLNSAGTVLLYSTYLGGSSYDSSEGIAVDRSENAYVSGYTSSSDFPTTSGAFDTTYNGGGDVFITKFNSTGADLVYSTFVGGSSTDSNRGAVIDEGGNIYVTGWTESTDYPISSGAYDTSYNGNGDAYITKADSTGTNLIYSTYLGGSEQDLSLGIKIDGIGNAYVTGVTKSSDFPTTSNAWDSSHNGGLEDAFVTKSNCSGTSLLYSTFLGGSDLDQSRGIAVDIYGNAYVTGWTLSTNFPTTSGAYDTTHNGSYDVFITKIFIPIQFPIFDGHDFTGNGRSDISVWRPPTGIWYIKGQTAQGWGTAGDIPVNGDYNGDNVTDIAVWRPSTGRWFVKGQAGTFWGTAGDIPVPEDYNGDVVTDYAVWRPSNGRWFVKGQIGTFWGTAGDIPVPGDYNGDGVTDYAVWRPSNGRWYIKGLAGAGWGQSGDIPVPGDYNGDGTSDIAVWRPSNGIWYIKGIGGFGWGASRDVPVPGDYNGDGVTDMAVWRPSTGRWYIKGQTNTGWGQSGDIPLVR